MPNEAKPRAFTLIELLVVITIIVVLLALLAPALDRAIYQAELTVCGANMRGLGTGVVTYAAQNKRSYPYRPGVFGTAWQPIQLTYGTIPEWDNRPLLRPYMSINGTLNCPLSPEIDLEGSLADTFVYASHDMWFGMQYLGTGGGKGMLRLGNRLELTETDPADATRVLSRVSLNLLGGSRYDYAVLDGYMVSAHPAETYDDEQAWQDRSGIEVGFAGVTLGAGNKYTLAGWYSHNPAPHRGPVDLNHVYDDGSVNRLAAVKFENDERTVEVPEYSTQAGWKRRWLIVPR